MVELVVLQSGARVAMRKILMKKINKGSRHHKPICYTFFPKQNIVDNVQVRHVSFFVISCGELRS